MKHTKATKEKLSRARRGAANPFYGRKHTPETRAKLAANLARARGQRSIPRAAQSIRIPFGSGLAYLAGIIDGEGSIRFNRGRPFVAIYNTDERLMKWLVETVGGTYNAGDRRGRKVCYTWRINAAADVVILCRYLRPLLIVKADDARIAQIFLEDKYDGE